MPDDRALPALAAAAAGLAAALALLAPTALAQEDLRLSSEEAAGSDDGAARGAPGGGSGAATGRAAAGVGAAQTDQQALVRQIKVDVFDENWPAVLEECERLLARYPASDAAPQATFYRARALMHLPGREPEASAAFRDFVARFPGDRLLVEQAWSSIFILACDPRRPASAACSPTLARGLEDPSPYVSTLAAIRAADTRDEPLRRRALATLKHALSTQNESDIRNEILIAILKIDPREVPPPRPLPEGTPPPPSWAKSPSLIRMTIYNKTDRKYDLRINVPVAFAQMLFNALGEDEKSELRQQAKQRGLNLDDIFEAIQKTGTGRFLDVDTPDSRIELWIE